MGFDAFSDCENIKSVYISDLSSWCKIDFAGSDANPLNVRLIPNPVRLYVNNVYVSDIVIPSDVRSIGYYAFAGYGMTSLTIPSSVELIKETVFRLLEPENAFFFNIVTLLGMVIVVRF